MKLKKPIAKFKKKDYPFVLDHSLDVVRKANSGVVRKKRKVPRKSR